MFSHTNLTRVAIAALPSIILCGCVLSADEPERIGSIEEAITHTWPGHLDVAAQWVTDIHPINNHYGSPADVHYSGGTLFARTKCGSFATQLMTQSYPGIITTHLLSTLTGSTSPDAFQWYNAIDPAQSHPAGAGGVSLVPLDAGIAHPTGRTMRSAGAPLFQAGDILAAKYPLGNITGHVMIVASVNPPPAGQTITLSGTHAIPGVSLVKRWGVRVYDSTSTVHGDVSGSTDTRYHDDSSEADHNDHGFGAGDIYLYEDASPGSSAPGALVGWTWSTGSAYTYQFTNPSAHDGSGKTTYRPMIIGRFSGGGL
jgi:hypothetical protein